MDNLQKKNFSKITLEAITLAKKAGSLLKAGFKKNCIIKKKPGIHNLVTQYDLLSEKTIVLHIKKKFPHHNILSEEMGEIDNCDKITWIIDPLDGTVNFAHQIPMFAVSIAIQNASEIVSGVIYHPLTDELFVAEKSKGAFLNGKKIKVTNTKKLKDAILATGFSYNFLKGPEKNIKKLINILNFGLPIRRIGSACLDLAYVAAGRFDGFWESGLGPWDIAAGKLLIEEAGGIITNWDGSSFVLKSKNAILATNPNIFKETLKVLHKK